MFGDKVLLGLIFSDERDIKNLEKNYSSFQKELQSFQKVQKLHHHNILKLSLNQVLMFWIKSLGNSQIAKYHAENLKILIEKKLLSNHQEKLEAFIKLNILKMYEKIRVHKDLLELEKESLCATMNDFFNYLEQIFTGTVKFKSDPIKIITKNKKVPHEQFLQFIEPLSKRDQLIAKVLYYGEPTLDEALELKVSNVLLQQSAIQFRNKVISYPKHIILQLQEFISHNSSKGLIFTNQKGKKVERVHINNCFERAFQKLGNTNKVRITPRDLLVSNLPQL